MKKLLLLLTLLLWLPVFQADAKVDAETNAKNYDELKPEGYCERIETDAEDKAHCEWMQQELLDRELYRIEHGY